MGTSLSTGASHTAFAWIKKSSSDSQCTDFAKLENTFWNTCNSSNSVKLGFGARLRARGAEEPFGSSVIARICT